MSSLSAILTDVVVQSRSWNVDNDRGHWWRGLIFAWHVGHDRRPEGYGRSIVADGVREGRSNTFVGCVLGGDRNPPCAVVECDDHDDDWPGECGTAHFSSGARSCVRRKHRDD